MASKKEVMVGLLEALGEEVNAKASVKTLEAQLEAAIEENGAPEELTAEQKKLLEGMGYDLDDDAAAEDDEAEDDEEEADEEEAGEDEMDDEDDEADAAAEDDEAEDDEEEADEEEAGEDDDEPEDEPEDEPKKKSKSKKTADKPKAKKEKKARGPSVVNEIIVLACKNPSWSAEQIRTKLTAKGMDFSPSTVNTTLSGVRRTLDVLRKNGLLVEKASKSKAKK